MTKILDIALLIILFALPAFPVSNAEEMNAVGYEIDPATEFMTRQLNEQTDSILIRLDSANENIGRAIKKVNNNL